MWFFVYHTIKCANIQNCITQSTNIFWRTYAKTFNILEYKIFSDKVSLHPRFKKLLSAKFWGSIKKIIHNLIHRLWKYSFLSKYMTGWSQTFSYTSSKIKISQHTECRSRYDNLAFLYKPVTKAFFNNVKNCHAPH